MHNLTKDQQREVASQFVEIIVDGMDTKTLVAYVIDHMNEYYENCTSDEIQEEIQTYDEDLYEELIDNVTQQYPKQRPQYYE